MSTLTTKAETRAASSANSEIRPEYWMTDLSTVIGGRRLREITMPGAHDAGISTLTRNTIGSDACNTQTQKLSIAEQLRQGARCFDLRPTIWGKEWRMGHFTGSSGYIFGSTGELVDDVLTAVANFAASHPRELLFLDFSHYLNLDRGPAADGFSPEKKIELRRRVSTALRNVIFRSSDPFIRFADQTLNALLAGGGNVICFFTDFEGLISPAEGIFGGPENPYTGAAPAHCIDANGVSSCVYIAPFDLAHELWFTRAEDGSGLDWSAPRRVGHQSKLTPALVAKTAQALRMVYVADNSTNQLLLIKSEDGGVNWSGDVAISGQSSSMAPSLVVGTDGTLYVVYVANDASQSLWFTSSKDDGATWSAVQIKNAGGGVKTSPLSPSLAIDAAGNLHVVYVANNATRLLLLISSTDGGKTWSADSALANHATNLAPSLAINSRGDKCVLYVAANATNQLLLITSKDNWQQDLPLAGEQSRTAPALVANGLALTALYAANDNTYTMYFARRDITEAGWRVKQIKTVANLTGEGSYAASDDTTKVVADQKTKFKAFIPRPRAIFSLNWQGTWLGPSSPCIKSMAGDLQDRLKSDMVTWVSEGVVTAAKRPNRIGVDYYDQPVLEAVLYLNQLT